MFHYVNNLAVSFLFSIIGFFYYNVTMTFIQTNHFFIEKTTLVYIMRKVRKSGVYISIVMFIVIKTKCVKQ